MQATVKEVNRKLVLDDPDALGMVQAVEAHNRRAGCRNTLQLQRDRVNHFIERARIRGSEDDVAIVLINADTSLGRPIADALMPGANWQAFRDQGQVPFARGLAMREGIEKMIRHINPAEADALNRPGLPIIVIDHESIAVFSSKDV
jgi:hypothetical protein